MRFSLLITAPPDHDTAWHACQFAQTALRAGHDIVRVFFADAGVLHAQALSTPERGTPSVRERWQALQQEFGLELVACVSAALHYGVIDEDNARQWEHPHTSIAAGFEIGGLGQLAEAQLQSDRLLTFPGAQ